jgi:hypothetical protein
VTRRSELTAYGRLVAVNAASSEARRSAFQLLANAAAAPLHGSGGVEVDARANTAAAPATRTASAVAQSMRRRGRGASWSSSASREANRADGSIESPRSIAARIRRGTPDSAFGARSAPARTLAISVSSVSPSNGRIPYSAVNSATQKLN